ncbi:molecular chaperone [Reticulibacter mediterranei]|uniref:Molecular chaperone n=1 Tax=Reticulibacter mediterranei TaxID=2778369 RepID=A0A8J3N1V5_9CHLR|nr:Hsp20 family protein [Reticulibacter mediterranei]GHO94627.1 molecular chaperone [Reticulibacter mediterranei]
MITRYDPFREAFSLRRAMDQLFDQSFVRSGAQPDLSSLTVPMDVCETEHGYEVDVAVPGARPEDIELTVDQNTLTIRGHYGYQNEHQNQPQSGQEQQQQAQQQGQAQDTGQQMQQAQQSRMERHRRGHNWLMREIVSGSFERSITFPKPIDADKIQTSFQNGLLTIQVPVSEASRPKRISISGGQGQQQQVAASAGQSQTR